MTASRKLCVLVAVGLLALAPAALAGPPQFTAVNYPGAEATVALGINPAGDIVGGYSNGCCDEHGFLLHDGIFTSYDYPGAAWTEFEGITPQGDIVGQYGYDDPNTHGFLLKDGHAYPIEVPGPTDRGAANSMPFGINPDGTIAGCYHQGAPSGAIISGTMFGFVLGGTGTTFDSLAGTMHTGINPTGDVTGYATNGKSYVITADDGVRTWFTVPGAAATRAQGISATGAVVGWYKDTLARFHGFLWRNGDATTIDVAFPGVTETRSFAVNPAGDIVGYYVDATGLHGFLMAHAGR